jgi:3-oxoadipate enol-lactonase
LAALRLPDATEDFLGVVYRAGIDSGHGAAFVVGAGGDDSDWGVELVGGVPERLVLSLRRPKAEMKFHDTRVGDWVLCVARGILCAVLIVVCVGLARGQNPGATPAQKRKMKIDGIAVEKTPQKLEGVQKTVSGHVEVAGGSKIYYEECGSGPAAVILLHDAWLHSVTWEDEWRPLCAKYHAIRYDRRGYGKSDAAKAEYSPVEDLLALIADRKIQRAVLAGTSTGAGIAVDFALAHPELVQGLFLIGPIVDGLPTSTEFEVRAARNSAPLKEGDAKAAAENWSRDHYILGEGHEAERAKFLVELDASLQNLKNADEFAKKSSPAPGTRLGEIHVPTEVLVGEVDIADVHAEAGAIEERVSGAQRDVIINAGDLVQLEQPEIVLEKLTNFVDRQQRVAVDVPVDVLQSYVGTYMSRDRGLTVTLDNGHLIAQAPGQANAPLFAESETKFFFRTSDVEVEFTKDPKGKITRAIIYQDGEVIKAARM